MKRFQSFRKPRFYLPLLIGILALAISVGPDQFGSILVPAEAQLTPSTAKEKASAVSAKKKKKKRTRSKSAKDFPCDPLMISAATGECAGTGDPLSFAGEAEKAGLADHPLALELSDLPKDRYGLIDWATAIKEKKVKPLDSLDPKAKPTPPLDLDVVVFTKSQFQDDVIFPHFVHTLWLSCVNCHPGIFPMNAKLANKMMTMPKIAAGEFCGRCHNRVAFPLTDCLRCHVKPKDIPPIDPNYRGASKKK